MNPIEYLLPTFSRELTKYMHPLIMITPSHFTNSFEIPPDGSQKLTCKSVRKQGRKRGPDRNSWFLLARLYEAQPFFTLRKIRIALLGIQQRQPFTKIKHETVTETDSFMQQGLGYQPLNIFNNVLVLLSIQMYFHL